MNQLHKDGEFLKTLAILYIEDDPDTRVQLGRFLEKRAGKLITADNGSAGLEAYRMHRPAIVITDIQMPGMDGLTLASEIRGLDAAVPIIVTTAFEQTGYLQQSIEIGVDKYVTKPVDPDRLNRALLECAHRLRVEVERAELEAQNRQLQKAESLGRMAGAVAHHFNNQLQVVMGNLEMAMGNLPQGAASLEFLADAMKAARMAATVSGLMLTYLGQTPGQHALLDMSAACRQSLALLQAAAPKGVILKVDFPDSGPVIRGNVGQIQQVLINLITNAWEAAGETRSEITLIIKTVSSAEISASKRFPIDWQPRECRYACLEVADKARGIPDKDIEKIFDPFFTTKFTGRGLGLPVALGIARTHDGGITVESMPGQGSVFRFFLPVSAESAPVPPK